MIASCYVCDFNVQKREDGLWYTILRVLLYYLLCPREIPENRVLTLVIINQLGKRDKTPKGKTNSNDNTCILLALHSLQNKDLRLTYVFSPMRQSN